MFGVSERRACYLLGQHRSTQRRRTTLPEDETRLVAAMRKISERHPRYGYRRVRILLRREGWRVNVKRIHRLWQQERLQVPQKTRKRRRLGSPEQGAQRLKAEHKDRSPQRVQTSAVEKSVAATWPQ